MIVSSDWHHLVGFIDAHQGEDLVLATLIKCEGSSYRQAGARLLVTSRGEYAGSLSGGCLEFGIAQVALQVFKHGEARMELVDTQPHFGCPGVLSIYVEKVCAGGVINDILQCIESRKEFSLITTDEGTSLLLDESTKFDVLGESNKMIEKVIARPRLIVVGWTTDHEPLFSMAKHLNWECHRVVRDEVMLVKTQVIAEEKLSCYPADELMKMFPPDDSTAVIIMSHHMATDVAYLKAAAAAEYTYIGLLGSKRRRETLLYELGEEGLLEDVSWLEHLYSPVGLDIGAQHPSTIALAILAEIQAVFAGKNGEFLSNGFGGMNSKEQK